MAWASVMQVIWAHPFELDANVPQLVGDAPLNSDEGVYLPQCSQLRRVPIHCDQLQGLAQ